MSPEPVTAERVYLRLKTDVISGRHRPRARLIEKALANEYGVSISPVRDSAERLVGERLLEIQPGGGFLIPDVTAPGLRDLYFWHGQLIRNALHSRPIRAMSEIGSDAVPLIDITSPGAIAHSASRLFAFLAGRSSNREHIRAVLSAGDRIQAVRIHECDELSGVGDELQAVQALALSGPRCDLIQAIWAYHRRRLRRISRLVRAAGGTVHPPQGV